MAVLCAIQCCMWCIEKCMKFINKNAYIQIALLGKKFCTAMKDAFWLVFRNAGRIAAAGLISPIIHFFGMLTITVATTMFGVVMVRELYPTELNNPYNCGIFYFIEGYVCGRLVMNVFGMGVDTMHAAKCSMYGDFGVMISGRRKARADRSERVH